MRIARISVKGLFGMFDHEIPLNQESRITIVHGPNGVGKTVLLRLIHALFSCDYYYAIDGVPFEQIRIDFDTGAFIIVEKRCQTNDTGFEYCDALAFHFDDGIAAQSEIALIQPDVDEGSLTEEIREVNLDGLGIIESWFQRVETGVLALWRKDDWLFTSEQLLDSVPGIHDSLFGEPPEWFAHIRREANTRLITTDRTHVLNTAGWIDDGGSLDEAQKTRWLRTRIRNQLYL